MTVNPTFFLLPLILQNQLIKYFQDKDAISPDSAIIPDENELRKKTGYDFKKLPFIKHAGSGKYYFDKKIYAEWARADLRNGLLIAGVIVAIGALIFLLEMII